MKFGRLDQEIMLSCQVPLRINQTFTTSPLVTMTCTKIWYAKTKICILFVGLHYKFITIPKYLHLVWDRIMILIFTRFFFWFSHCDIITWHCNSIPSNIFLALTRYTTNGILHMLDRNRRIKTHPEKFKDSKDHFDMIITCEERVYDQVLEGRWWPSTS